MATSTLTSKGQVTIPKEIRRRLRLRAGDRLDFRLGNNGQLTVVPADEPSFLRLFGMLRHRVGKRPVSVDEMREAVHELAGEKFCRQNFFEDA